MACLPFACDGARNAYVRETCNEMLEQNVGPSELHNLRHSAHWLDVKLRDIRMVRATAASLEMMQGICARVSWTGRREARVPITTQSFLLAHAIYAFPGIYFIEVFDAADRGIRMRELQSQLFIAAKQMLLLFYDVSRPQIPFDMILLLFKSRN